MVNNKHIVSFKAICQARRIRHVLLLTFLLALNVCHAQVDTLRIAHTTFSTFLAPDKVSLAGQRVTITDLDTLGGSQHGAAINGLKQVMWFHFPSSATKMLPKERERSKNIAFGALIGGCIGAIASLGLYEIAEKEICGEETEFYTCNISPSRAITMAIGAGVGAMIGIVIARGRSSDEPERNRLSELRIGVVPYHNQRPTLAVSYRF